MFFSRSPNEMSDCQLPCLITEGYMHLSAFLCIDYVYMCVYIYTYIYMVSMCCEGTSGVATCGWVQSEMLMVHADWSKHLFPKYFDHFLVGGLEHALFFRILGIIIPTDIFQKGWNHQPVFYHQFSPGFWLIHFDIGKKKWLLWLQVLWFQSDVSCSWGTGSLLFRQSPLQRYWLGSKLNRNFLSVLCT